MPTLDRTKYASAAGLRQGAYVLADAKGGKPEVILIATGSEVGLAVGAFEQLGAEGVGARVVSMPSWELFEHQTSRVPRQVLPPGVTARVAVEQASTFGWERYVGLTGQVVGMTTFGASAPAQGSAEEVRLHPRRGRRGRQGSARLGCGLDRCPGRSLDEPPGRGRDVLGVDAGRRQELGRLARGRHVAHRKLHDARPLVRVGEGREHGLAQAPFRPMVLGGHEAPAGGLGRRP